MNVLAWFVTSKTGLTILLALALAAGGGITWFMFAKHYRAQGVAQCEGKHLGEAAIEAQRQARENVKRNADASRIANTADAAGAASALATDVASNTTREVIRDVYHEVPRTKSITGSCVHPVDKRVQAEFDKAVGAANGK